MAAVDSGQLCLFSGCLQAATVSAIFRRGGWWTGVPLCEHHLADFNSEPPSVAPAGGWRFERAVEIGAWLEEQGLSCADEGG